MKKLLELTKEGQVLNEKQINSLIRKLGFKHTIFSLIIRCIIATLIVALTIYCFLKIEDNNINWIILGVTIVLLILVFTIKFNRTKKIIKYLDALQEFYLRRFSEFEGFESIFVAHQVKKKSYLQNNLVILISNGIDFYIFDDIFEATKFRLPRKFKSEKNKTPVLKIISRDFGNKRPVHFKQEDIYNYELRKGNEVDVKEKYNYGYEYKRYTYSFKKSDLDNYCMLSLVDGSTYKLGSEAIVLLRKKAIGKEKR